jgi:hypothetical protein
MGSATSSSSGRLLRTELYEARVDDGFDVCKGGREDAQRLIDDSAVSLSVELR